MVLLDWILGELLLSVTYQLYGYRFQTLRVLLLPWPTLIIERDNLIHAASRSGQTFDFALILNWMLIVLSPLGRLSVSAAFGYFSPLLHLHSSRDEAIRGSYVNLFFWPAAATNGH